MTCKLNERFYEFPLLSRFVCFPRFEKSTKDLKRPEIWGKIKTFCQKYHKSTKLILMYFKIHHKKSVYIVQGNYNILTKKVFYKKKKIGFFF